jgi:hypothetical protein
MQFGLYHLLEKGAWRKVSEDSGESRPFLLIDCTERLSLPCSSRRVLSDTQCFQHIAKFIYVTTTIEVVPIYLPTNSTSSTRLSRLPMPIVTAAVYRGFDQELRLAADPIN